MDSKHSTGIGYTRDRKNIGTEANAADTDVSCHRGGASDIRRFVALTFVVSCGLWYEYSTK